MADNTLDRLDRDPGGARRYCASLYVIGGATHEQVAQKLAERFGIRQPSKRIVGEWRRNDEKLIALIEELDAVKRDMSPDATPADVLANVPAPIDPADTSGDLFDLTVRFPTFGKLLHREGKRDDDDPAEDDVLAVLAAGHPTGAEFEADCERRCGDYDPHVPTSGAGALA